MSFNILGGDPLQNCLMICSIPRGPFLLRSLDERCSSTTLFTSLLASLKDLDSGTENGKPRLASPLHYFADCKPGIHRLITTATKAGCFSSLCVNFSTRGSSWCSFPKFKIVGIRFNMNAAQHHLLLLSSHRHRHIRFFTL